jgi:hypothetical protein
VASAKFKVAFPSSGLGNLTVENSGSGLICNTKLVNESKQYLNYLLKSCHLPALQLECRAILKSIELKNQ